MRRIRARHVLPTLSLALGAATCALWWRTANPADARSVWFERSGELSGLRATAGRLAWVVPPPPVGSAAERTAADGWVADLDRFALSAGGPQAHGPMDASRQMIRVEWLSTKFPCTTYHHAELADRRRASVVRPLLDALADPRRFFGAHVLLAARCGPLVPIRADPRGGRFVGTFDGMEVDFGSEAEWQRIDTLDETPLQAASPASIPALRRQWADRLAVPEAAVPLWALAAAFAVLPVARLTSAVRGRTRRRSGRCRACGYDLRASPGRCPECGAAAAEGGTA